MGIYLNPKAENWYKKKKYELQIIGGTQTIAATLPPSCWKIGRIQDHKAKDEMFSDQQFDKLGFVGQKLKCSRKSCFSVEQF